MMYMLRFAPFFQSVFAAAGMRFLLILLLTCAATGTGNAFAQAKLGDNTPMLAPPPPEEGEPYNDGRMVIQSVPQTMFVNELYDVSITMKNTGTTSWYRSSLYRLGALANDVWGIGRVELPTSMTSIGGTPLFKFQVRAPSTPGTYTFQWRMLQENKEWFGVPTTAVTITVRDRINNAAPSGQNVPTQMETGQPYTVSVTMVNNGETTWNWAQQYTLMSQSPHNNTTWGFKRVPLPVDNIAPGQSTTFTFNVTAPNSPGSYPFQWGMQREGYGSFGPGTNVAMVNVVTPTRPVNNAEVVGISVPARMQTQQNYNVAVTMRNNGTTTWTPGALYRLGSQNPHDNQMWGPGRIELTSAVAPGQQYTFNFQVKAPAPAEYQMQWGMVQDNVQWFGAAVGSPVVVTEDFSRVTFIHTDGLGSPVARTDGDGAVISRTRYEPYGYVASGATPTIGFTGHVNDADTGLTYMQQRYYDPVAGRFLSIDPVVTDANTGGSFNRYAYANNNPYKYIDPDGRSWTLAGRGAILGAQGGFLVCGPWCSAAGAVVGGALTGYAGHKGLQWIESRIDNKASGTNSGEGAKDGKKDTLQPGPHADESIPARGPGRDFSKDERDKINEIGQNTGCHTCGSKDPGTTSGNHIPDHQPPNALNPSGGAQELYPHCLTCSRVQGGQVRGTQSCPGGGVN